MIYFLLDNKSLSVFTESSTRQNSSLVFKAKLHSSIISTINNSKKLNSIIARALDEISEEINLTNNLASIIIDDSILSHSIIIKSKKYDNIDQQIREESQLKWGDKIGNYYFISEEKKTPKNIFHSVAIHHFLREKIKLNFNNFGMNINYLIPLSSVVTTGLKSTQFATIKNGKKFTFFSNTKKGFMFFKANFSGTKKSFEKIIGLLDLPKIQLKELDKSNLKFIFFNRLKIVEYLDNFILKDVPLLNFAETSRAQIIGGEIHSIKKTFNVPKNNFDYQNLIRNFSSGIISILFLTLIISFFSDYKFLDTEQEIVVEKAKEVEKNLTPREIALSASHGVVNKLKIAMNGDSQLNSFVVSDNAFNVNEQKIEFDNNSYTVSKSNTSASYGELLIKLFEIDSNLKFKVFNSKFDNENAINLVLRFEKNDSILDVVNEIESFNNMFVKKVSFSKEESLHLYVTIIES